MRRLLLIPAIFALAGCDSNPDGPVVPGGAVARPADAPAKGDATAKAPGANAKTPAPLLTP